MMLREDELDKLRRWKGGGNWSPTETMRPPIAQGGGAWKDSRDAGYFALQPPIAQGGGAWTPTSAMRPPAPRGKVRHHPTPPPMRESFVSPKQRVVYEDKSVGYEAPAISPLPRPLLARTPTNHPPPLVIFPGVGPTEDAKQRGAKTYSFTPQAEKKMRETPAVIAPQGYYGLGDSGGFYKGPGGDIPAEIVLYGGNEHVRHALPHEFSHKWWETELTPEQRAQWRGDLQRWAQPGRPGNMIPLRKAGDILYDINRGSLYSPELFDTETYARAMTTEGGLHQGQVPAYMRPYTQGLLNLPPGAGQLPPGAPPYDYSVVMPRWNAMNQEQRPWAYQSEMERLRTMFPDENGRYG